MMKPDCSFSYGPFRDSKMPENSSQDDQPFSDPDPDGILTDMFRRLSAEGATPKQIAAALDKTLPKSLPKAGTCLLAGLRKNAPEMLADRRAIGERFRRRLRRFWGKSFNLVRMLLEAAREAGEEANTKSRPSAAAENDVTFDALVRLHARACLVTSEVLWQMEGGFASGAMARWRTLHEVTIVSFFIAQNGNAVAERYLLHHVIETEKAARQYNEHCKALGMSPLPKKQLDRQWADREALCMRFGPAYATDWGWAAEAIQNEKPSFAQIEKAVDLDRMRPYFKLSCHSNHAGSKGINFDLGFALTPDNESVLLAGPSNAGFYDPAYRTAVSLLQVTTNLLVHRDVTITALIVLHALSQLVDEIETALASAERDLSDRAPRVRDRRRRFTSKRLKN
jgi:hypothetical protein